MLAVSHPIILTICTQVLRVLVFPSLLQRTASEAGKLSCPTKPSACCPWVAWPSPTCHPKGMDIHTPQRVDLTAGMPHSSETDPDSKGHVSIVSQSSPFHYFQHYVRCHLNENLARCPRMWDRNRDPEHWVWFCLPKADTRAAVQCLLWSHSKDRASTQERSQG